MKTLTTAALIAAQLAATPGAAASLEPREQATERHRSAFAGARLRIPFGGADAGRPRAELTLAPMEHGRQADGQLRGRIGEGVELGLSRRNEIRLAVAGASFGERLAAAQGEQAQDAPAQEGERPRRRRTTGQHILRGAAVAGIITAAVLGGLVLFIGVACSGGRCDE